MTKRIINSGKKHPKISSINIAKVLGAEPTKKQIEANRSPISLYAVRKFIVDQLTSTGGRPSLKDIGNNRKKIPIPKEDWEFLQEISNAFNMIEETKISTSQVAAALLHLNLNNFKKQSEIVKT